MEEMSRKEAIKQLDKIGYILITAEETPEVWELLTEEAKEHLIGLLNEITPLIDELLS